MAGAERVSAWSDLLDRINVFPVTDYDTGRNLVISLSPLLGLEAGRRTVIKNLLLFSRGNSGIIASQFLVEALGAQTEEELDGALRRGRDSAWKSITEPRAGTMLSVFDALVEALEANPVTSRDGNRAGIIERLENAVLETTEGLPRLKQAGVVDSGALGMFIFLEAFFRTLSDNTDFRPIAEIFGRRISISPSYIDEGEGGYCVSAALEKAGGVYEETEVPGGSAVRLADGNYVKLHFHTDDFESARKKVESFGRLIEWSVDDIALQKKAGPGRDTSGSIRVMTDAAGSLSRELAAGLGITLLNSYITLGARSLPETFMDAEALYKAMREGSRATTSQASAFERREAYRSAVELYGTVLYLCVGSVYTGNYETALKWKNENERSGAFAVIDTGAASGRLAVLAIACSRYAAGCKGLEELEGYASRAMGESGELIFIDRLQYLAAGGRLSKAGAFFGDMIKMKPVVSPTPEGAKKVGAVYSIKDQLPMAIGKIRELGINDAGLLILLEYTDNRSWVEEKVRQEVEREFPRAEVIIQPMSLTTGVHVGPGTWGIAYQKLETQ